MHWSYDVTNTAKSSSAFVERLGTYKAGINGMCVLHNYEYLYTYVIQTPDSLNAYDMQSEMLYITQIKNRIIQTSFIPLFMKCLLYL